MSARTSKNALNLSESLEDYLEAIAELIAVEGHAHTKDIAEKLKVKMPSVTGAIRQLKKLNYIIYNSHCPVMLTAEGKAIAEDVMHRHKVGMAYPRGELGLADKPCHVLGLRLRHLWIKHLDCEERLEHAMPSEPNGPQSALADLLFDHIAVERLAGVEHGTLRFKGSAIFVHVPVLALH